ncbi:hypothetical protein ACI09O_000444 [Cronobacter muytjensii]
MLNAPVFTVIGVSPLAVRRLVYTALFYADSVGAGWQVVSLSYAAFSTPPEP